MEEVPPVSHLWPSKTRKGRYLLDNIVDICKTSFKKRHSCVVRDMDLLINSVIQEPEVSP